MPSLQEISAQAARTVDAARARLGAHGTAAALRAFIAAGSAVGPFDSYRHMPAAARALFDGVDAPLRRLFLRAALAQAVADLLDGPRFAALPPRVAHHHALNLARIAAGGDDQAEWLALGHDIFQKEFGLATLRLYAAGSQLVDTRCGVARSLPFKGPLWQAPAKIVRILLLGGFKPYFQVHTHKFNLDAFSEQSREECYLCCAELYALHPESLGMFGCSWFYDPVLATISPRLAYLRETAERHGAQVLFMARDDDSGALARSPTRQQLHREGKYRPSTYMLLWGKKQQLAWARRRLAADPAQARCD